MEDRDLFKAKRISDGEWIIGYLYRLSENNPPFIMLRKYGESYEVDEHTICRCTGSKDKNGNLIWENDVARCEVGIAEVIWDKSGWRTKWLKNDLWRKDLHYWAVENSEGAEVIGNIFDNPELLYCNYEGDCSGDISHCQECSNYVLDCRDIKDQPTTYDVNKVVKQLKNVSYERFKNAGMGGENVVNLDDAIEIVKIGGKNDTSLQ